MAFTSGELRDFVDAVRGSETSTECVVTGTVVRVDVDGTAWVQIGQNAEPTPCARDMACHAGDEVTVRIADHKATVTGNASAPATDDKKANVAYNYAGQANETATVAQDTAEVAQSTAIQAKKVASNAATKADVAEIAAQEAARVASAVNQHFWDDERGAHVTEEKKDDYLDEPSGFQNLMTSIGNIFTKAVNGIERILRSDTASGMVVYDGECAPDAADLADHAVAAFTADGAQIGKSGESHAEIDSSSLKMVNRSSETYLNVEDMNTDPDNPIEAFDIFNYLDGTQVAFELSYAPSVVTLVRKDSSTVTSGYTVSGRTITFSTAPTSYVEVNYETQEVVPNFTLGTRASGSTTGLSSVVEGINNTASNVGSHAEGANTTASGRFAHAEGNATVARGFGAHAEGQNTQATGFASHAEGSNTTANGQQAHAEGQRTRAGHLSHAEGNGTIANGNAVRGQHVEGVYNIEDNSGTYAHIIGSGTSDINRSNLHTVDWNGTAWYENNGNVICSDGTNIRCDGQTIGSADNLSYVINGAQFVTRRIKSAVYSIGANAQHISYINCPTISGYTPIAVVGFQNNHGNYLFPIAVFMTAGANQVTFGNKNQTSTSFNDAFDLATVLYAKTGLVDRNENW